MLIKRAFQTHAHTTVRDFLLILFFDFSFRSSREKYSNTKKENGRRGNGDEEHTAVFFGKERLDM